MKTIGKVAALALCCVLQAGWAQEALKTGGSGAVTYASGGVGTEARDALAARRDEFNLYVTFARGGSGEMLAGVTLSITDRRRNPVLAADDVGPLVYVKLPPGTYWVNATANGQEQSRSVTVGARGGREVAFHWVDADQATVR